MKGPVTSGQMVRRGVLDGRLLASSPQGASHLGRLLCCHHDTSAARLLSAALGYRLPWLDEALRQAFELAPAATRAALAQVLLQRGVSLDLVAGLLRHDPSALVRRRLVHTLAGLSEAATARLSTHAPLIDAVRHALRHDEDAQTRAGAVSSPLAHVAEVVEAALVDSDAQVVWRAAAVTRRAPHLLTRLSPDALKAALAQSVERLEQAQAPSDRAGRWLTHLQLLRTFKAASSSEDGGELRRWWRPAPEALWLSWANSPSPHDQPGVEALGVDCLATPLLDAESSRRLVRRPRGAGIQSLGVGACVADAWELTPLIDVLGSHKRGWPVLMALASHPDAHARSRIWLHLNQAQRQEAAVTPLLLSAARHGDLHAARALVDPWPERALWPEVLALAARPDLSDVMMPALCEAAARQKALRREALVSQALTGAVVRWSEPSQADAARTLQRMRGVAALPALRRALRGHMALAARWEPHVVSGSGPEAATALMGALRSLSDEPQDVALCEEAVALGLGDARQL